MKAYKQIASKLKNEGRTQAWLGYKIGVSRQLVHLMMKGKTPITEENLKAINKALQTDFTNEQQKKPTNVY